MNKENSKIGRLQEFLDSTRSTAYWYPLTNLLVDVPVAAYYIHKIYEGNYIVNLEQLLKRCNANRGTMIQIDHGLAFENENLIELLYEIDEDGYVFPWYSETYFYDESKKWMIYISHERTITFAGKEMVAYAKELLSDECLCDKDISDF